MKQLSSVLVSLVPEHLESIERVRDSVSDVYRSLAKATGTGVPASTNYYYYYPYLFSEAFPEIDNSVLRALAVAGVLYLDHVCLLDDIVDDQSEDAPHRPFASALLHEQSLLLLNQLFPPASPFWQLLSSYHLEFAAAMIKEQRNHKGLCAPYPQSEWLEIAKGKSALSKGTTAAMAILSGRVESLNAFSESQDNFNIAMQLYDDVRDWRDDLKRGLYSAPLTRAIELANLQESDHQSICVKQEQIGHHLYYSGIVDSVLGLAIEHCSCSIDAVGPHSAPKWTRLTAMLRDQINRLRDDLSDIGICTQLRARGYLSNGCAELVTRGVGFLLSEQDKGYPEASHGMNFDALNAGADSAGVHSACVFQRAIIVDVLQDLQAAGILNDPGRIALDIQKLIDVRLSSVRGGWSYFPSLPDLPPDADDLGQILQVLVRSEHPETHSLVDDPIALLFESGLHPDGSFETWIVDPRATDSMTRRMMHSIENAWGSGPDVEVVANLSYALALYGGRFSEYVDKAVNYVEDHQEREGFWIPTWYSTRFYGTYAALRLLALRRSDSAAFARAAAYLLSAQRHDGGCGENRSTPLETALALLCWCSIPPGVAADGKDFKSRALRYLELTMEEDGSWGTANFIQMDLNRARRNSMGYRPRLVHYKSRTLSTAYVLKAILSAGEMH